LAVPRIDAGWAFTRRVWSTLVGSAPVSRGRHGGMLAGAHGAPVGFT
jgi:hypothetical protein